MIREAITTAAFLAVAATAGASGLAVTSAHVAPIAGTEGESHRRPGPSILSQGAADTAVALDAPNVSLGVYPVAGTFGRDYYTPYFVDLDATAGSVRDYNCGSATYDGHTGHDPYIRSFSEQAIGVPVFAVADGTVVAVHDGEPDENTTSDPSFKPNYVTIRHAGGYESQYVHLRRGSVTVSEGATVVAGTQIGMIGSSGASTAPHMHFQLTYDGAAVEPFAGPCRAGVSFVPDEPPHQTLPVALGATLSDQSFGDVRPAPYDDAHHTGTFTTGMNRIYLQTAVANLPANSTYVLTLESPSSSQAGSASGTITSYGVSHLDSVWWAIDAPLTMPGTWSLNLAINGRAMFQAPFTVVAAGTPVVNRAPNPVSAVIQQLWPGVVPVCRANSSLIADPDYDVVRYRYTWKVDDHTVRDVTTAASTDALARNLVVPGAQVSCTVTPSDGQASAEPSTAYATADSVGRRRATR